MRLVYINAAGGETKIEAMDDLVAALSSGLIKEDTLMRREGEAAWEPAKNVEEVLLVNALKLNFYNHGAAPMVPLVVGEDINSKIFPAENLVTTNEGVSRSSPVIDQLLSSARRIRAFLIVGAILSWFSAILEVWFFRRLEYLSHIYGYGNVPANELPPFEEAFVYQHAAFFLLSLSIILFSFFKSMFRLRDAIAFSGKHKFSRSKFVIVLSLFVPVANFFVPWLGMAEIRRAAISLSSPREAKGFGWASFILGGVFAGWIVAMKILQGYYQRLGDLDDVAQMARGVNLSAIVNASLVLFLAMSFYFYATSVLRRVEAYFLAGVPSR